jgi:asparagine synthase (glutamine-hydrolysing)
MCGIAGILNLSGRLSPDEMRRTATRMAEALAHRGPDDQGIWLDETNFCALAHRRLSIIDTSPAGHQPMASPDGRQVITYNGELYNFPALRAEFAGRGESFRTESDTEVMLTGLRRENAWFLTRAEAMFALGWYDCGSRSLLLARDPFGEKPLYYTEADGVFAFASELSALAVVPGFDDRVSLDGISAYLAFQHVPAPGTLYDSCRKLAPGHYLRVTGQGAGRPTRYFTFLTGGEAAPATLDEQADRLEEILLGALRGRLLSDVPLGAFLSGGVDSSTAVALIMRRLNRSIATFSIGFAGSPESEHEHARDFARHLGTEHHEAIFDPRDYVDSVDLARRMDEPNSDTSCVPTHLVSGFARRSVTVAITGDGGDEMFGGYQRYADCVRRADIRAADIAARRWHPGRDYYCRRVLLFDDPDIAALLGHLPDATGDLLLERRRRIDLDTRPLIHRLREADVESYLPEVLAKVDRMSMLHGLECRTPYLSTEVARFAAGLPAGQVYDGRVGKPVLRRLAARYLPAAWLARPKRGFGLEPFNPVVLEPIMARARSVLGDPDCALSRWVPAELLARYAAEVLPTLAFYHAWSLLVLELWLSSHPARPAVPVR